MLQTNEGKQLNDKMADTCILRRTLKDDHGKDVTVWPSVTVLGAGMRNDGKRLAATLKKFRSELAKTSTNFWSNHATPPRRASLIEKQIMMQRRKNEEETTDRSVQQLFSSNNNNSNNKRWTRPDARSLTGAVYTKEDGNFGYIPIVQ